MNSLSGHVHSLVIIRIKDVATNFKLKELLNVVIQNLTTQFLFLSSPLNSLWYFLIWAVLFR